MLHEDTKEHNGRLIRQGYFLWLISHGFAEWLLNKHTERCRLLINKLIELFEQIQYEEKEKIVDAIANW